MNLTALREGLTRRWRAARAGHWWLDHVVIAWNRFKDNHGNYFAAAVTYFSFLALFPLVLLVVAVLGFVLRHNPDLQRKLLDKITSNVPGDFGSTLKDSVNAAIRARTGIGVVALVGLLLTGLGWIGHLRAAINAVWGVEPPKKNFVATRVANLGVLAGLGVSAIVSIGLTVLGTAFTDKILRAIGADGVAGVHTLAQVFGIALAVAGDLLIFGWVLVRLPRAELPFGVMLRGALLAAVGFEVLKIVGAYYIERVTRSPTAGIFGGVIGILVWIDLVSRYLLYCAAWTATAQRPAPIPVPAAAPAPAPGAPVEPVPRALSPLGVAGSLFAAGAAAGGGAVAWLTARRRRRG